MQSSVTVWGNMEATGGDPTRVVFSAPLHGGSLEEWVTGLTGLRDSFQGVSLL